MLDLPPGEVHVWWAEPRLDADAAALLDPAERVRLEGYRRDEDKARFVTGTAIVRRLAAAALQTTPKDVKLDRTCPDCDRPHGKVRIAHDTDLEVSISHSGAWVVVAAYRGRPIGVDVEEVDAARGFKEIAGITMSDREQAAIGSAADFTKMWARKEAVVKALGEGLRRPLTSFEVSGPDAPASTTVDGVHLVDLECDDRHQAAVAVVGEAPVRVVRR